MHFTVFNGRQHVTADATANCAQDAGHDPAFVATLGLIGGIAFVNIMVATALLLGWL